MDVKDSGKEVMLNFVLSFIVAYVACAFFTSVLLGSTGIYLLSYKLLYSLPFNLLIFLVYGGIVYLLLTIVIFFVICYSIQRYLKKIDKIKKIFFLGSIFIFFSLLFIIVYFVQSSSQNKLDIALLKTHQCYLSCDVHPYYYQDVSEKAYFYSSSTNYKQDFLCVEGCKNEYWFPVLREHDSLSEMNLGFDYFSCDLDQGKAIYDTCIQGKLEDNKDLIDLTDEKIVFEYPEVDIEITSLICDSEGINVSITVVNPPHIKGYDSADNIVFVFKDEDSACDHIICSDKSSLSFVQKEGSNHSYRLNYDNPYSHDFETKMVGVFWQSRLIDEESCN